MYLPIYPSLPCQQLSHAKNKPILPSILLSSGGEETNHDAWRKESPEVYIPAQVIKPHLAFIHNTRRRKYIFYTTQRTQNYKSILYSATKGTTVVRFFFRFPRLFPTAGLLPDTALYPHPSQGKKKKKRQLDRHQFQPSGCANLRASFIARSI